MKLKYVFLRLKDLNYNKLFETVNKVKQQNNKPKILIILDIIYCAIKYQSGYNDYYSFGMYNMNKKQRSTILTRGKNNNYVKMLNPKEYWHIFDNKDEFNKKFQKYLKRDWLYLETTSYKEFEKFLQNKKEIIAKPRNDSGGHGIEKIILKDYPNKKELYNYLLNKKLLIVEEIIKQHDKLNEIYPESVNTIRLITILHNNVVNFVTAFIRIGNNSFVDNTSSGGMLTMLDLKTGITQYPACDTNMNIYKTHPKTKTKIKGIKIPYFLEAKKLVEKLSYLEPHIKYIAWDIAITKDGPVVVEANPYPGYYYQFPIHTPNKIGYVPIFEQILNSKT